MSAKTEKVHKTVYIVFISLLLDLLAFTMILPLLPSLLDHYKANDSNGLYRWLSNAIHGFQVLVGAPEKFNSVLLGGILGSMYSFLQFLAAPVFGGMSDVMGRKKVMLMCLVGVSLSYVVWALSSNLIIFIIARFLGGISKGNVSLSMAIITDVSSIQTRTKGMAFVGIAFSLGFIIGPLIGAVFAVWAKQRSDQWFIVPALFALLLSLIDLAFFASFFKESLPKAKRAKDVGMTFKNVWELINVKHLFKFTAIAGLKENEKKSLQFLGLVYFVYLLIYSGLEFTLTFLTHHTFNYTAMQQGWMFFAIGLTMALIQGSYVRRIHPTQTRKVAVRGLWLIIPSFIFIGVASEFILLYLGLLFFSVSTAMVVPSISTMASEYGTDQQKGAVMGIFRSLGALARAVGPIFASISFWSVGSSITYLTGAFLLLWPALTLSKIK